MPFFDFVSPPIFRNFSCIILKEILYLHRLKPAKIKVV